MGKLYERDDIYDLLESESRDAITRKHYETIFNGKNIKTLLGKERIKLGEMYFFNKN